MATSIEVASNALVRIGAGAISSFSEGGASGVAASNLYEVTIRSLLTEHPWTFCRAKRQLSRLTATPLNEYQYAFQIPSDSLQVLRVFETRSYKIFEDKVFANTDVMFIDYLFRADEARWPYHFQICAEYLLASEFALIVTSNEEQNAIYENKFRAQLKKSKYIDSRQVPMEESIDSPYRDVRV